MNPSQFSAAVHELQMFCVVAIGFLILYLLYLVWESWREFKRKHNNIVAKSTRPLDEVSVKRFSENAKKRRKV